MRKYYSIDLNYKKINSEKKGLKIEVTADIEESFGMEIRSVATASPISTMRIKQLSVMNNKLTFRTLLHCTIEQIIFATNSTISSLDALPEKVASDPKTLAVDGSESDKKMLEKLAEKNIKENDWLWRLSKVEISAGKPKIIEHDIIVYATQVFLIT